MNINPNLPINSTASKVVSKSSHKGANYNPGHLLSSSYPLPTRPFTGKKEDDLSGRKKGRFTVIGASASFNKSKTKRTRWVCKCTCGRYEIRTTLSIKNGKDVDCCIDCKKLQHLKNKSSKISCGIYDIKD